jgi:hemerythrin
MAIQLTPDLLTGVELLDSEHKMLLEYANNILDPAQIDKAQEAIKFLGDYIATHFQHEEKLQLDSGYPKYEMHKNLHRQLTDIYQDLQKQSTTNMHALSGTAQSLVKWLIDHIHKQDIVFAKYYKEKMK